MAAAHFMNFGSRSLCNAQVHTFGPHMSLHSRTDSVPETVSDGTQSATTIRALGRNRTSPQTDSVTPRPLQLIGAAPGAAQLREFYPSKSTAIDPKDTRRHSLARTLPVCRHRGVHAATINNTQHRSQPYEITNCGRRPLSGPSQESASGYIQERVRTTTGRASGPDTPRESATVQAAGLNTLRLLTGVIDL